MKNLYERQNEKFYKNCILMLFFQFFPEQLSTISPESVFPHWRLPATVPLPTGNFRMGFIILGTRRIGLSGPYNGALRGARRSIIISENCENSQRAVAMREGSSVYCVALLLQVRQVRSERYLKL